MEPVQDAFDTIIGIEADLEVLLGRASSLPRHATIVRRFTVEPSGRKIQPGIVEPS